MGYDYETKESEQRDEIGERNEERRALVKRSPLSKMIRRRKINKTSIDHFFTIHCKSLTVVPALIRRSCLNKLKFPVFSGLNNVNMFSWPLPCLISKKSMWNSKKTPSPFKVKVVQAMRKTKLPMPWRSNSSKRSILRPANTRMSVRSSGAYSWRRKTQRAVSGLD